MKADDGEMEREKKRVYCMHCVRLEAALMSLDGKGLVLLLLLSNDNFFFFSNDNLVVPHSACCIVCLFVCGISLTSGQLINELFPDCTRSCFCKLFYAAGAVTASMR